MTSQNPREALALVKLPGCFQHGAKFDSHDVKAIVFSSVLPGPAALALLGNLLEMHILGPYLSMLKLENHRCKQFPSNQTQEIKPVSFLCRYCHPLLGIFSLKRPVDLS